MGHELNRMQRGTDEWGQMRKKIGALTGEFENLIGASNKAIEDNEPAALQSFRDSAIEHHQLVEAQLAYDLATGAISRDQRLAQIATELAAWDTSSRQRIALETEAFNITTAQTRDMILDATQLGAKHSEAAIEMLQASRPPLAQTVPLPPPPCPQIP